MANAPQRSGEDRERRIARMRHQAEWLEGEAARLHMDSPLVRETVQRLRQHIKELESRG